MHGKFHKFLFAAVLAAAVGGLSGISKADNAGPRVLVIPFTTLNVPDNMQWVAKAVQEDVVSDFGRVGGFTPVTMGGQEVVEDNATATRIGKQVNAAYVVRGAVQQLDQTVRLTGQVIDTRTGDTVQTGSVTGPVAQLLTLEDELAKQLRGASPLVNADGQVNPTQPITPASNLGPSIPMPSPTQIIYVPDNTPYPPYYNNPPYDYADYGDYYPGFYNSPIVLFSSGFGFGFHHHGFHDGFHGHDGDRGRFTFSSRDGGSVGGFNQFHSPRITTTNGPLITQPVFNSRPAFNSMPVFNRVGFNTGFGGNSFGRGSFSSGGGFHNGGGFGGGGIHSGGGFGGGGGFHSGGGFGGGGHR